MDMTDAIKEAYAYADPAVTLFDTFEISHSSWLSDDYIRLVDSDISLETPEGTFEAAMLDTALPETESSVRGQMTITINCLPVAARDKLYNIALETDPVYVQYRQYTGANESPSAELPVALTVSNIEFKGDFETTITCLYPDLVNIPFCRKVMTTTIFPGGKV